MLDVRTHQVIKRVEGQFKGFAWIEVKTDWPDKYRPNDIVVAETNTFEAAQAALRLLDGA